MAQQRQEIKFAHHRWPRPLNAIYHGAFDLALADPPYNLGVAYDDDSTGDIREDYEAWCWWTMRAIMRLLRPGGTLWWLTSAKHAADTLHMANSIGRLLHGVPIIWHERFSQYRADGLTVDYRMLFPIVKPGGPVTFNPDQCRVKSERQRLKDKRANPKGRVPGHVWQVRRLQGTAHDRVDWHPAQLPPEPLELILKGWTNPGGHVLDAFAGSGNMGLACKKLGRNFLGVDQSEKYIALGEARLAE